MHGTWRRLAIEADGHLFSLDFSPDGGRLSASDGRRGQRVWRRRRPERWWGVVWLAEFRWTAAAFVAFAFFLVLDVRFVRRRERDREVPHVRDAPARREAPALHARRSDPPRSRSAARPCDARCSRRD